MDDALARRGDAGRGGARGVGECCVWGVLLSFCSAVQDVDFSIKVHLHPSPFSRRTRPLGRSQQRDTDSTQASTFASMLLASFSPHSASVAVSSTPLYTKRSTALAPAACSLVFRSAAVSDGEIWIDTFDSVIFKLCVGVIHGVSGIGGYEGGVRLMSDRRDFLGRVCSWCFVAFFSTW